MQAVRARLLATGLYRADDRAVLACSAAPMVPGEGLARGPSATRGSEKAPQQSVLCTSLGGSKSGCPFDTRLRARFFGTIGTFCKS